MKKKTDKKSAGKASKQLPGAKLAVSVLVEKVASMETRLKKAASSIENLETNIVPKVLAIRDNCEAQNLKLRRAIESFVKQIQ